MSNKDYYDYLRKQISLEDVCYLLGMSVIQKGTDKRTLCPFHNDHDPSLKLYTDDELPSYHCFACGAHGDVFSLIKKQLNCNFSECMKWIETKFPQFVRESEKYNIKKVKTTKKSGFQTALECYQNMTDRESQELSIFASNRGYSPEFLIDQEIFYVEVNKLLDLYGNDIEAVNVLLENNLLTEVVIEVEDKPKIIYKNVFGKDKIMITLRDYRNQIEGFAARAVDSSSKPKYLFTKKLPKGQLLYGLNTIEQAYMGKPDETIYLYITEGIFDALRLKTFGLNAIAVLGSHITNDQTEVLAGFISDMERQNNHVILSLFLDWDEAGLKGTNQSIRNMWLNNIVRTKAIVEVCVSKDHILDNDGTNRLKDPDEILKKFTELKDEDLDQYRMDAVEYWLRYALDSRALGFGLSGSLSEFYKSLSLEQQVAMLGKVSRMLPINNWQDVFAICEIFNHPVRDNFALKLLKTYWGLWETGEKIELNERNNNYDTFPIAIEIAKNSYLQEDIPLDDSTWNRLFSSIEVFADYFSDCFTEDSHLDVPLISFDVPKNSNEYRPKKLYCPEQLVMQQYVLNELLREDVYRNYQNSIPAIRFDPLRSPDIYVTGDDYYEESPNEVVSFAYQINMPVINGDYPSTEGMFRPYYDCYKNFIDFIREGINQMQVDVVYTVKLDISKFYDSVTSYSVQSLLEKAIQKAISVSNNRFSYFRNDNNKAAKITNWIVAELFNYSYYLANNGEKKQKENTLRGIPQGPNLSAYVANSLLFDLDLAVQKYVNKVNEEYQQEHRMEIAVRFARYVDDMVIVAVKPEYLLNIEDIVVGKLGELELTLSPKTDEADGKKKEDAYAWLLSEKGGLGVSLASDEAIEPIEDIFSFAQEQYSINRRQALNMLHSYTLDTDDIWPEDRIIEIITTFFKAEEVRYNDVVRFSELYIKYLFRLGVENINQKFIDDLTKYSSKEFCPPGSMLLREGILEIAFLQACTKMLRSSENGKDAQYKKFVAEFVQKNPSFLFQINFNLPEFKKNQWTIYIIILQLLQLAAKISPEKETFRHSVEKIWNAMDQLSSKNEYRLGWQYAIEDSCGVSDVAEVLLSGPPIKSEKLLANFHYTVHYLSLISKPEEFKQLKINMETALIDASRTENRNILIKCLWIWLNMKQDEIDVTKQENNNALKIFVNIVNKEIVAEVIAGNEYFKQCILPQVQNLDLMPVPPGVGYPGILAFQKPENSINADEFFKIDFNNDSKHFVKIPEPAFEWGNLIAELPNCKSYSEKLSMSYIPLQSYLEIKDEDLHKEKRVSNSFNLIANIHEMLANNIQEFQTNHSQSLVFSHFNVFIQNDRPYILTYETDRNICGIAISQDKSIRLQTVPTVCDYYWKAGHILKDALNIRALDHGSYSSEQYEFLNYIFKRLTGEQIGRQNFLNKEQSFIYTVERARQALRDYAEKEDPLERKLFLTDYKLINQFIAYRMKQSDYTYACGELEYHLAKYAKECLYYQFKLINDLGEETDHFQADGIFLRRVPSAFIALGKRLQQKCDPKSKSLGGIETLIAGLYAFAIMANLKQQVTELVFSFSSEERSDFLKKLEQDGLDFSWELLNVDIAQVVFITINNNQQRNSREHQVDLLSQCLKELLKQNAAIPYIGSITPIGWLAILCFLMELDKTEYFILEKNKKYFEKERNSNKREMLLEKITEISLFIQSHDSDDDDAVRESFPFEGTKQFFATWDDAGVDKIGKYLKDIDEWNNIEVQEKSSKIFNFSGSASRQKVSIIIGGYEPLENRPSYFMTYQCLPANTEKEVDKHDRFLWTQSIYENKIIGISSIDKAMSKLAFPQIMEEQVINSDSGDNGIVSKTKKEPTVSLPVNSQMENDTPQNVSDANRAERPSDTPKGATDSFPDDWLHQLQEIQWKNWGDRTKVFVNLDRIALLQFDVESSYFHPDSEVCSFDKIPDEPDEDRYSCAEFRRRAILTRAFTACSKFEVDILLLPEYSVRPETVLWIKEQILENRYTFSVWAGTFRIPANSGYTVKEVLDLGHKDIDDYVHCAALPVIPKYQDKQQVKWKISHRFKKYPAINLQESIHPKIDTPTFKPILLREDDILYQDARDDIIEVICAEIFMLTSPSNHNLAMYSAYKLYNRYEKSYILWDKFQEKCFSDVVDFGKYTALHQLNSKYGRRSIVLIPACTTRATDYYVHGQATYLASGLTTVFCNMTSGNSEGGSCFIGTDCWDKNRNRNAEFIEKYLPDDTPYFGLSPGVYQQSSSGETRGALGKKEQALVICDVNPDISFTGKPNPQSMGKPLELVAHLPIIEIPNIEHNKSSSGKCRCSTINKGEAAIVNDEINDRLKELYEIVEDLNSLKKIDFGMVNKVCNIFKFIGEKINSKWLEERGKQFVKQYNNLSQRPISPNLLDWIYVDVKYPGQDGMESNINVPCFSKFKNKKGHKTKYKLRKNLKEGERKIEPQR